MTALAHSAFLDRHWSRPLASQGDAPPGLREASLDPESCGQCHAAQFEDWRQSLHSRAMGPGVLGQLLDTSPTAEEEHQACIRCHAPLREQAVSLAASLAAAQEASTGAGRRPLHEGGLVCAGCHVRGYQWYGPPRRDGSQPKGDTARLPHGGWIGSTAFADSRFCAACHQFDEQGYALNGKLLENTYEEWRQSRHAREGRTCQSCHMPDRRHLWRGIHDRDMVRAGVTVAVSTPVVGSGSVAAALTIRNSGTGHHFPTYVTPRVVAAIHQEDARGKMIPGTSREHVIGRQVSADLSKEIADTRIAPDAQVFFEYSEPLHAEGTALVFVVRVEPDYFYTGLYRSLLRENRAGKGEALIRQALEQSTASAFELFSERRSLR